ARVRPQTECQNRGDSPQERCKKPAGFSQAFVRLFGPVFLVSQLEVDILYTEPGLRGKGLQWKIYRNPARQEEYVYTAAMPAPLARAAPSAFPSIEPESLSALLDLAPDAFVVVDSRAILVLLNAQVETLFGYRREELVGQALERLLPGRLQAAHAARRAAYLRTAQPRPMGVGLRLVGPTERRPQ